jgi:uncharacterized membrane protein
MSGNKKSLKSVFRDYMAGKTKLEAYQKLGVLFLIVVFAGFFGWVYEMIFYFFDGGTGEFYMQGGNFLPWINIYAIGALVILATTWRLRKYPWAVLLISVVTTGIIEFVAGWLVYTIGNGTRYWDYNTEILNFGNIGGFVCLRSVLFFGVSALFLIYMVVPFFVYLAKRMSKRAFLTLAISLFAVVMMDEMYNILASKMFYWPDAMDFWRAMGWKYLT